LITIPPFRRVGVKVDGAAPRAQAQLRHSLEADMKAHLSPLTIAASREAAR
jgi:hypothetical protein